MSGLTGNEHGKPGDPGEPGESGFAPHGREGGRGGSGGAGGAGGAGDPEGVGGGGGAGGAGGSGQHGGGSRSAPRVAVGYSLLLFAAFALAGYSLNAAHTGACAARNQTLNVVASIIVDAKKSADTSPFVSPSQRLQADGFYAAELLRIQRARC